MSLFSLPLLTLLLLLLCSCCDVSAFFGIAKTPMRQRRPLSLGCVPDSKEACKPVHGEKSPCTSRSSFLSVLGAAALAASVSSIPAVARATVDPATPSLAPRTTGSALLTAIADRSNSSSSASSQENTRRESISGFVAGAALTLTKTVVKYPLDTATVRLQMPNTAYSIRELPTLFADAYVGITGPLVANVPAGAVFFAVKDAVQTTLTDSTSTPHLDSFTKTLLSVAVAQIPYWVLRNPSEVVKTRQQAGQERYKITQGVSGILQAYEQVRLDAAQSNSGSTGSNNQTARAAAVLGGGWDAYYTGYWENVLYAYPADVIKFAVYDSLSKGSKQLPPATGALYGAIATAVAQCVTTPLDVVRNRVMAASTGSGTASTGTTATDTANAGPLASSLRESSPPLSYTETLVQLARQEGLAGLFAGVTPRVGKAILSGAIQFATYEETKQEIAKLFAKERN